MRRAPGLVLGLPLLLVVALSHAATAGDPVAPDLDRSIARAEDLQEQGKWAEGAAAWRRIFTDFADDARVRAQLHRVEDGLKVCLFRSTRPPIQGADVFGPAAKRFNPTTRDVTFEFGALQPPHWISTDGDLRILDVRLDGAVTIEVETPRYVDDQRTLVVLLCYDVEKRGGYALSPGYRRETGTSTLEAPSQILKVSAWGSEPLANRARSAFTYDGLPLVVTRSGGEIVAKVGKETVVRATDTTFTGGYVGFVGWGTGIKVKGRIDRHAWRKKLAEHYGEQFATWEAASWDRDEQIPGWARASVRAADDSLLSELPSDAPDSMSGLLTPALAALVADDDAPDLSEDLVKGLPERTGLYVRGVVDLALHRHRSAVEALDRLVALEPDFAPARLIRGRALFHLRRVDEARAEVEWLVARRPNASAAHALSATIAIFDGDLARAGAVLAAAAERGVADDEIDLLRGFVHRAQRGPSLAQRFEHTTDRFVVVSDHSKKICYDTATLLESMQQQYTAALGPAPRAAQRSRVYVFAGHESYLEYADDLLLRADSTAGVYLPMLRELVLWIPLDMTDFRDTVRHEGFHQYMHRLADDVPIWLNEGYAGFMGGGGPEGVRHAERDAAAIGRFVCIEDLVQMDQAKFLRDAEASYAQARYLVDFLRSTKHEKLRHVLRDYVAAVLGGLSQEEANEKVLAPVMDVLEVEFRNGLRGR